MSTTITTANHILVEKNSNQSDISLCPRAPWSMSLCSLLPTVPSTTNPHLLYVARHVNSINNSHFNHHHQSILHPLKKILTKMIHPNVSDLPGLLLQVVLAAHAVVDHHITFTRSWAALRAADLDWIVGPGYSLGRYILEKNHEKPWRTNLEPWKTMKTDLEVEVEVDLRP